MDHTAATFVDVDPADLELDAMNSGQSHRQRLTAELETKGSSSRGRGIINHVRRGDISVRGGHSAAR
jgi:hypothetical protein